MSENPKIEYINKMIASKKRAYLDNAAFLRSDYDSENSIRDDYKKRQIFELMQNADDCHNDECPRINIKFTLKDNLLIVQNNGSPFSELGITSLMYHNTSTKTQGSNTIGFKGLGFRSVLNWSKDISIYTDGFNVHFSEENAKKIFNECKSNCDKLNIHMIENLDRIAILDSTIVDNDLDERKKYLEEGYVTSIVLKCDEQYIEEIQQDLKSLQFEELLFLKHIEIIEIDSPDAKRIITSSKEDIKDGIFCGIQEKGKPDSWWYVWPKEDYLDIKGKHLKYELAIAYNIDKSKREELRKSSGYLYSFFKTEERMPLPFLIHGTFELKSERNWLNTESGVNNQLLNILCDFIIDRSKYVNSEEFNCLLGIHSEKQNNISNYEPLINVLPYEKTDQLDKNYDFTDKLRNKIKQHKIFPTIGDTYISLSDNPKYSDLRFDQYVEPRTFNNLLKHCDDEVVQKFIIGCGIGFYYHSEFCELINKDADKYISRKTDSKVLKLFYDKYKDVKGVRSPLLLVDSDGNRITDYNTKIFTDTADMYEPPNWSQMKFIDSDLKDRLFREFDVNNATRHVKNFSDIFNILEYSVDKVASELNRQARGDADKIRDVIKWLYLCWIKKRDDFPSKLTAVDLYVLDRNGDIVNCSKCFFGSEYDNLLGEPIIIKSGIDASYIAGIDKWHCFDDTDRASVKEFFSFLGVRKYPPIISKQLDSSLVTDYIHYNFDDFSEVYTDDNEKLGKDSFANATSCNVVVSTIDNLELLLKECSFLQIVNWIFDDKELNEHLFEDRENNSDSYIQVRIQRYAWNKTIRKAYMRSYIRKVFAETDWIPTKNVKKSKTNAKNLMFQDFDLSPIIETIKIEYNSICPIIKKRPREIEILFEKLGVVNDFTGLPKEKIYEALLKMPSLAASDYHIAVNAYRQLNEAYKEEKLEELIKNNSKYNEFRENGFVLVKQEGVHKFVSVKESYYLDNKVFSDAILSSFPLLALGRRAGKEKVKKLFCVDPIENMVQATIINKTIHQVNDSFQTHYKKILPYIYSKRIDVDKGNANFNALIRTSITIVSDVLVEYALVDNKKQFHLTDYEILSTNEGAVIKVPSDVSILDDLKQSQDFKSAFSEVITTIVKVAANSDAYQIIFGASDNTAIEKYLSETDENLESVNKSKSMFSKDVDYKEQFWERLAIAKDSDKSELYLDYKDDLPVDFNYENPDPKAVITFFKLVGVDLSAYNDGALYQIHLSQYFEDQFANIKRTYRNRYLIYALSNIHDHEITKQEYRSLASEYDFKKCEIEDSVFFDPQSKYEEIYSVKIEAIEPIEDNLETIVMSLTDGKSASETKSSQSTQESKTEEEVIDYVAMFNESAAEVDGTYVDATTERVNVTHRNGHKGGHSGGGAYDPNTNKWKDLVGFIAEMHVYNTIKKNVGDRGSIRWLSGNSNKAHINENPNDNLGYDMEYSVDGVTHYVEVKGSSGSSVEFNLSKNEYEVGVRNKKVYEIWFVFVNDDRKVDKAYKLGTLFDLPDGESFINNSKYTVENSEFKIKTKVTNLQAD